MRSIEEDTSPYTWWDYRAGAFHRDLGYRIDLLLASTSLYTRLTNYTVHREQDISLGVRNNLKHLIMLLL